MNLETYRKQIDELDAKLVALLNERTRAAMEIGRLKQETDAEIYVPAREKAVLDRVTALNEGPLEDASVTAIYREIMSAALALEHPMRVAYLGPEATFTHQAARSRFGGSVAYTACATISDVFAEVAKRKADYGVVPVENSIEGAVTHTFDELSSTPLKICAEISLPISHHLMAAVPQDQIRTVYSHPQVFGQCRAWLQANLPGVDLVTMSSTARAAETAAREPESGALASALAAELYGLNVLQRDIQDAGGNTTRFLVVGKRYGEATGSDKTSLYFAVRHEPGSLCTALDVLRAHGLNMTKIESRPNKTRQWEYLFFVDVEGHASDERVKQALTALEAECAVVRVLGSYPRATNGKETGA
jgi:chorismate mutase / prephenate dehydratase